MIHEIDAKMEASAWCDINIMLTNASRRANILMRNFYTDHVLHGYLPRVRVQ